MSDRKAYKAAWYQRNKERVREKRYRNKRRYYAKPGKWDHKLQHDREQRAKKKLLAHEF